MGTCPPHPADKRTVNVSFCQCPMMNCIRALSLNGRLDNQSGGQVHFHNHYLDVFFARWLPTPERTTSDMSAHSLVNSIKPDRGQKYQFHLRPLAFGEIIIFTPTSGSLSKKSSIFCTPTATQGRTTKNTLFLCRAGWEHPRRKCIPPHS